MLSLDLNVRIQRDGWIWGESWFLLCMKNWGNILLILSINSEEKKKDLEQTRHLQSRRWCVANQVRSSIPNRKSTMIWLWQSAGKVVFVANLKVFSW